MAKYRLIEYKFGYNFGDGVHPAFPSFALNRPSIYLGVAFRVLSNYLIDESDQYALSINKLFAYPLHALYDGSLVYANAHLADLLQSVDIDCTELEVTGEYTFTREDFYGLTTSPANVFFRVYFLERIS